MTHTAYIFKELLYNALEHTNDKGFLYFKPEHQTLFKFLYNFSPNTIAIVDAARRSGLNMQFAERIQKTMMSEMRMAEENNEPNKLPYLKLVKFIGGAVDAEPGNIWPEKVIMFINNNMWDLDINRYLSLVGRLSVPKEITYNEVYQYFIKWRAKQNETFRQKEEEIRKFEQQVRRGY